MEHIVIFLVTFSIECNFQLHPYLEKRTSFNTLFSIKYSYVVPRNAELYRVILFVLKKTKPSSGSL